VCVCLLMYVCVCVFACLCVVCLYVGADYSTCTDSTYSPGGVCEAPGKGAGECLSACVHAHVHPGGWVETVVAIWYFCV